ncbi:MAG: hypothetical protein GY801_32750 [bacterium]|nr:hypothetical protein [bacterium]
MSLKVKLSLCVIVFAFVPIVFLEGYRSWVSYHTQLTNSQRSLLKTLHVQKQTLASFFDGMCQDIAFIAQMTEFHNLLTSFEDGDVDEIDYWADALTTVLQAFAEGRHVFRELYFIILDEDGLILGVDYVDGQASPIENPVVRHKYDAIVPERPLAIWEASEHDLQLWLHFPIQEGNTLGVISVSIDLHHVYTLNENEELYLIADRGFHVITAGMAALNAEVSNHPFSLPDINESMTEGTGITRTDLFSFVRFTPITWMPEDLFTLYNIRPKSAIMASIQAEFLKRGLGMFCILLVLMCFQIAFLHALVVKPLNRVAEIAVTVTNGNFEHATQLASSATETSVAVRETTTTLEKVRQTAQHVNDKAQEISANAQKATHIAQAGQHTIEHTLERMHRIRHHMTSIVDSITHLSEQSQAISEIIGSVGGLAGRSSLLAVNTLIASANVGEQGKGFTAIAQEIRVLAEQSKQSTREIQTMLDNVQKAISEVVIATEQGTGAVDAGMRQASETRESIQALVNSILETAQAMSQISISTQEQVVGIQQVVKSMESIRVDSTQNVDRSHQLESSAQSLEELGQLLQEIVDKSKSPKMTHISHNRHEEDIDDTRI